MTNNGISIDRVKQALIVIGCIALVFGSWMSYSFGTSMKFAHGVILGVLTVFAAIMFVAIDHLKANGLKGWKINAITALSIIFLGVEFLSHVGYTVGTRVENTEMTGVQNTKYSDSREQVVDNKANVKMWQERLAQLKWNGVVTADALRAKLPGLELAIAQESKRGGCGPICLQRTKERDDVQSDIAKAEEAANLTKQIAATQALVDKYREKAAVTEFKSSPIVNQTKFMGQLVTLSLEPDQAALTWTQIAIAAVISLVTTFLSPFAFYLAFGDNLHKASASRAPTNPAAFNPLASVPAVPPVEHRYAPPPTTTEKHTHEVRQPIMVDDRKGFAAILEQLKADPRMQGMAA